MSIRPTILIIWPTRFRVFDWERLELYKLEEQNEIVVHELIDFLAPQAVKAYSDYSNDSRILRFRNFSSWLLAYIRLLHSSIHANITILDFVNFTYKFKYLFIKLLISSSKKKVVTFSNPGVPIRCMRFKLNLYYEFKISQSFKSTINRILKYFTIFTYYKILNNNAHIIIGGSSSEYYESTKLRSLKCNLHNSCSWDYSNYLVLSGLYRVPKKIKYAVYLDGAGPMFSSDTLFNGNKNYLTTEKWYPALCKLFDLLEKSIVERVIIVGHPKTVHDKHPSYFGYRRCYNTNSDKRITQELVSCSSLVITRLSTAISYAIIYNKPIILVTSNQLLEDPSYVKSSNLFCSALELNRINIDSININDIMKSVNIKSQIYDKYTKKYLSLTKNVPISQILNQISHT